MAIEAREDRARRAIRRKGDGCFRLQKTPARAWQRAEYGPGYQVIDSYGNTVVFGYWHRPWQATLQQIEEWSASS
ncbi:hypothetical protein [Sphingomonas phyllosphaerae]|uniref:hypothetical protein n=1 Tax=Sphingomonas phyllosphaerae TaxID=257003 RepID=UPI002FF5B64C